MSFKYRLRTLFNRLIAFTGFELIRPHERVTVVEQRPLQPPTNHPPVLRASLRGALEHAKSLGLKPGTVIDVGAASGTPELYETFPESRHLLIEPLEEFKPYLDQIVLQQPQAEYVIAAAAASSGEITINVHPDLYGSSLYRENEDSDVNGIPRVISAVTLDELCAERKLPGPYVLKVDVQGAELDVLMGATHVLEQTQWVALEVSLFEFFEGGPQFYDIVHWMKQHNFVVYEFLGYQYRLLDYAMSQIDIVFVPDHSEFRKHHFYATPEQRAAQTKQILAQHQRR